MAARAIDGIKARDRNIANDEKDKEATNVSRGMTLTVLMLLQGLVVFVVLVKIDEDNNDDDSDSDADARVELFSLLGRSLGCCGGWWVRDWSSSDSSVFLGEDRYLNSHPHH